MTTTAAFSAAAVVMTGKSFIPWGANVCSMTCVCAQEAADGFVEELVVRANLAENYCYYERNYDNINGAANWAKESLEKHRTDKREHLYTL